MKSRGFTSILAAIAVIATTGACATGPDMSGWTPQQIYAYRQAEAMQYQQAMGLMHQSNQQSQQLLNQAQQGLNQTPPPVIMDPKQPGTTYVYCRELGTYVVNCRN